ncbi:hypothetical protein AwErysi_01870 [Erysipelotrichaceae bacterium]|nr:hypothetical protein AwErysi_01870 [Erysipelotrichaceae bacterium]
MIRLILLFSAFMISHQGVFEVYEQKIYPKYKVVLGFFEKHANQMNQTITILKNQINQESFFTFIEEKYSEYTCTAWEVKPVPLLLLLLFYHGIFQKDNLFCSYDCQNEIIIRAPSPSNFFN